MLRWEFLIVMNRQDHLLTPLWFTSSSATTNAFVTVTSQSTVAAAAALEHSAFTSTFLLWLDCDSMNTKKEKEVKRENNEISALTNPLQFMLVQFFRLCLWNWERCSAIICYATTNMS